MKNNLTAHSVMAALNTFEPQKNNDVLFSDDLNNHFSNRYKSNICFIEDGASGDDADGQGGGDDAAGGGASSILGDDEDQGDDDQGAGNQGGDDDSKGDDDNTSDDDKDDETKGAPEKYEITLPEGAQLSPELLEKAEPVFRELNLDNEQASKLATMHGEIVNGTIETIVKQQTEAWQKTNEDWVTSMKSDSEYGGANSKGNFEVAKSVISHFGGDESKSIRQALSETGAGNHPEIMRLFYRIGNAMKEDSLHGDIGGGGNKQPSFKDLYKNTEMND